MFSPIITVVLFLVTGLCATAAEIIGEKLPLIPKGNLAPADFIEYSMNGDVPNVIKYINQKGFPDKEIINDDFLNGLKSRGYNALATALSSEARWWITIKFFLEEKTDKIIIIKKLLFSSEWGNLEKVFYGMYLAEEMGLDGATLINREGKTPISVASNYPDVINFLENYQYYRKKNFNLEIFPSPTQKDFLLTAREHSDFRENLLEGQERIVEHNYNLIMSMADPQKIDCNILSSGVLKKILADHKNKKSILADYLDVDVEDWGEILDLFNDTKILLQKFSHEEARKAGLLSDHKMASMGQCNKELFKAINKFNFDRIDELIKNGCKLEESIVEDGLSPAEFALKWDASVYAFALRKNIIWNLFNKAELLSYVRRQHLNKFMEDDVEPVSKFFIYKKKFSWL